MLTKCVVLFAFLNDKNLIGSITTAVNASSSSESDHLKNSRLQEPLDLINIPNSIKMY